MPRPLHAIMICNPIKIQINIVPPVGADRCVGPPQYAAFAQGRGLFVVGSTSASFPHSPNDPPDCFIFCYYNFTFSLCKCLIINYNKPNHSVFHNCILC